MAGELDNLEEQILAWMDGELGPAAAAELEAKLAGIPEYQHLLKELQQQREALRATAPLSVPAELAKALEAKAARGTGVSGRRYRLAASILLMVGVGAAVYQMLPGSALRAPQEQVALGVRQELLLGDAAPATPSGAAAQLNAAKQTVIYLSTSDIEGTQQQVASVLASNNIAFTQAQQANSVLNYVDSADQLGETNWPMAAAAEKAEQPADERYKAKDGEGPERSAGAGMRASGGQRRSAPATPSPAPRPGTRGESKAEPAATAAPRGGELGVRDSAAAAPTASVALAAPAPPAAQVPNSETPLPAAELPRELEKDKLQIAATSQLKQQEQRARSQQVFVARNLRSSDVAQVEKALQAASAQQSRLNIQNSQQQGSVDFDRHLAAGEKVRVDAQKDKELRSSTTLPATEPAVAGSVDLVIIVDAEKGAEPKATPAGKPVP